jgi:hypothetical protein
MRTYGVKVFDYVLDSNQVQWIVLPSRECPDHHAESRIIQSQFRVPHEPWGAPPAFVHPVIVRRSRRRVLFYQQSGVEL